MTDESVQPVPGHHPSIEQYVGIADIARQYDAFYGSTDLFQLDRAFILEHLGEPKRVVELGCGTGRLLVHLARHGHDITGVDLSPYMLEEARRKLDERELQAELIHADVLDLGAIPDESFDGAIAAFSLLGMILGKKRRAQAVREWHRILRPGGKLLAHVHGRHHHLRGGRRGIRLWLGTHLGSWLRGGDPGDRLMPNYRNLLDLYLHTFSVREFRGLFTDAGFEVTAMEGISLGSMDPARRMNGNWRELDAQGFLIAGRK